VSSPAARRNRLVPALTRTPARAVPYFIYRGDRVRLERGRISVRALRGPTFELDFGTSGSLGSSAWDVKAREGMPDLGRRGHRRAVGVLPLGRDSARLSLTGSTATIAPRGDMTRCMIG
jgi:hypothetical protein